MALLALANLRNANGMLHPARLLCPSDNENENERGRGTAEFRLRAAGINFLLDDSGVKATAPSMRLRGTTLLGGQKCAESYRKDLIRSTASPRPSTNHDCPSVKLK